MLTKKFIFENDHEEDPDDWSDYKNIVYLAKNKISPYGVTFETSDGESFDDIIEVTRDGIIFTFDGLKEYLQFFFPEDYGEEYSDGELDASSFDSMYNGYWSWADDLYEDSLEEWREGYIIERFKKNHLELIRDITKIISPRLYTKLKNFLEGKEKYYPVKEIRDFLDIINIGEDITEVYSDANYEAIVDEVPKGIEDTYCDCLSGLGIERLRHCFLKYKMDWGSCLMLYARFGTDEDKLLDLLFEAIRKDNIRHLPMYYEMRFEFYDGQKFEDYFYNNVTKVLEEKLEETQYNRENYDEEYLEIIDKISQIGGINNWIITKDKKYQIKITDIDPTTNLISYDIRSNKNWKYKRGKTDIDSLISIIYNEKLFNLIENKKTYI